MNFSTLIVDNAVTSGVIVAALIVVFGLLVYGFGDLARFTPRRVWAISGVVFRESIRRKILWLTPLVMLSIVALTGLQRPEDALDAIRQTLQFSLFASGLLVVVTGVMLSCTNLPRDIETKVIFTIVTKPTTRLEIVLGKIIGFARVTAAILLLMGVFTWGYVQARAWQLGRDIAQTLELPLNNEFARGRLEHLRREGLLDTRRLAFSGGIDTLAREADPGSDVRWISPQQTFAIPFRAEPTDLVPRGYAPLTPGPGEAGVAIRLTLSSRQVGKAEVAAPAVRSPLLPTETDAASPFGKPSVLVSVIDTAGEFDLIPSTQVRGGRAFDLEPGPDGKATILVQLAPEFAAALTNVREWSVAIAPQNENFLIGMEPGAASVIVPGKTDADTHALAPLTGADGQTPRLAARGGAGRAGRLVEGPQDNYHSVAVARFAGLTPRGGDGGTVSLELKMDLERLEDDASVEATQIEVEVANPASGRPADKVFLTPEKNLTVYADLPAAAFAGGTFDVRLRTITRGHAVTLTPGSIAVVASRHSFGANLAKALASQWMLSVLVVTIGTFCSTFVSWPIAIVLSLVVLMARWAVDQVSDSLQPGIGALLATDIGATDATQARVISSTFDGLARMLNFVAQFLPDINRFSVAELVERGLLIPMSALGSAALVLVLFGLPLLALSYVLFRNKEVAP